MDDSQERVDLVDENDVVIGSVTRLEAHEQGLLHRAVHVLLFDRAGSLILQKRSESARFNPGCWTSTISGHVGEGETYEIAAHREVTEELGLAESPRLEKIGKAVITARNEVTHSLCRAWTTVYTGRLAVGPDALTPQAEELTCVETFSLADVLDAARDIQVLKDQNGETLNFANNFRPVIEAYFRTKDKE